MGRLTFAVKTTAIDSARAYTLCEALEPPGYFDAMVGFTQPFFIT